MKYIGAVLPTVILYFVIVAIPISTVSISIYMFFIGKTAMDILMFLVTTTFSLWFLLFFTLLSIYTVNSIKEHRKKCKKFK
ncbi:hypothetical protein PBI_SCTP2_400 [Salicola phage SCTP-2]|nr:hypothetical protein PBI_SCTP2_400 [Salicola phage SCTP-2]